MNYIIYALWAFAAGAVIPVMATFNAQLARSIGSAPAAVMILLFVGALTAIAYALSTRASLPEIASLQNTKTYLFTAALWSRSTLSALPF